jgi:ABC-type tungstate transport system substrate-binding protein
VRVARFVAQLIGWIFVGTIGYHAVLAVSEAAHSASKGNWAHAVELIVIAIVATALVVAAVVGALRARSARPSGKGRIRRR